MALRHRARITYAVLKRDWTLAARGFADQAVPTSSLFEIDSRPIPLHPRSRERRIHIGLLPVMFCLALWLVGRGTFKDNSAAAQTPGGPPGAAATTAPADTVPPLARLAARPGVIQAGDWVRVTINGLTVAGRATGITVRVGDDGTVGLPLVGAIDFSGLMAGDAQAKVTAAYKKAQIISDPVVTIERVRLSQPGDALPGPIRNCDLVRLEIYDLAGPGVPSIIIRRVAGDGTVVVPIIGPIKVRGLTDAAAAVAIAHQYSAAQLISNGVVIFVTLEPAPPNAERLDLPDGPVYPVPESLKSLFVR